MLTQLAALLGRAVVNIRKTSETPPRISVIDVVEAITGQVKSNAGKTLERVKERHPEVYPNWINFRFPGRGQRDTPVADVRHNSSEGTSVVFGRPRKSLLR